MKRRFDQTLCLFLMVSLFGCLSSPEVIDDISTLPQDSTCYLNSSTAHREVISLENQQERVRDFKHHFFLPWNQSAPSHTRDDLGREFAKCRSKSGYGENGRKITAGWLQLLAQNADLETYPNAGYQGITIDASDLRLLPTAKPHFSSLTNDGTGYPFDNWQNSAIPANTPIYVAHVAKDKSWVLADSPYGSGWLPIRDVAPVNTDLVAVWEHSSHVAITKDDVAVYDDSGAFLFTTNVGAQFPKVDEDGENYRIMVARTEGSRIAQLRRVMIPKDTAVAQPLPLTSANIAAMANELMNKPYGWGGLYRNRDCSSMLKDLFVPFGIWLPRHSSHQALEGGGFLDLGSLTPEAKERMILQRGIPFLTLIWVKGHIMLYIGSEHGRAIVFHNLWGIKTRGLWGREGRKVVGHAAITTLRPGVELPDADLSGGDLLTKVEGMRLLVVETR
jgi:cell wall-associated NlpC family hydrolase